MTTERLAWTEIEMSDAFEYTCLVEPMIVYLQVNITNDAVLRQRWGFYCSW